MSSHRIKKTALLSFAALMVAFTVVFGIAFLVPALSLVSSVSGAFLWFTALGAALYSAVTSARLATSLVGWHGEEPR